MNQNRFAQAELMERKKLKYIRNRVSDNHFLGGIKASLCVLQG